MIDSLSLAAASMNGVLRGNDRTFAGISTDSRTILAGQLFFALQGPNFDGEEYVDAVKTTGAAAAVVHNIVNDDIAQIIVDDTRCALGRYAQAWRQSKDLQVVGVTGSNGKTTLKELIAAILRTAGPTLATRGNLNNDIGMPLTLAQLEDKHTFAVLELGANRAGEVAYLASLLSPDVVVITNAGAAHLEGFGSVEGVAHAKGELLQIADRPKVAVLNADDDYFPYWSTLARDLKIVSFGLDSNADVRAENIVAHADHSEFTLHVVKESTSVSLPLSGRHNVRNACAAAAVANALGIEIASIKNALETVAPVAGRLQPLAGINGCVLFDDSYNANPLSVIAAAEFLAELPGESWLVLGDMAELGGRAEALHREVGAAARASGIDRLLTLGKLSKFSAAGFGNGATCYTSLPALLDDLLKVDASTNVLVKGSRSMRMERVVVALRDAESMRREA